jgi:hypothetical protein
VIDRLVAGVGEPLERGLKVRAFLFMEHKELPPEGGCANLRRLS